jgi:hypothetical protein
MKRILSVLAIAALMVSMLAVMAVPAFAQADDACIGTAMSAQANTQGRDFAGPVSQRHGENAANTTGYKDAVCPSGPA